MQRCLKFKCKPFPDSHSRNIMAFILLMGLSLDSSPLLKARSMLDFRTECGLNMFILVCTHLFKVLDIFLWATRKRKVQLVWYSSGSVYCKALCLLPDHQQVPYPQHGSQSHQVQPLFKTVLEFVTSVVAIAWLLKANGHSRSQSHLVWPQSWVLLHEPPIYEFHMGEWDNM